MLWEHTAGNRPPQPAEERAFFEQVWSQNFSRSKVKYDTPVEFLIASTPIAISPFNSDDGFSDDDDTPVPGGGLSNYNLAAPFNAKPVGVDGGSVGDSGRCPAAFKAAQADAAEATSDNDLVVLVCSENFFGTTASKSFPRKNDDDEPIEGIDTVSVSIASYRVVESKNHGKYAQYLVIFCDGNFQNTIGEWKRHSDFSELGRKVTHGHSESCSAGVKGLRPLSVTDNEDSVEILPNAITSWKLLKKRQRWYRCLDAGYLSLKVFFLERFLHDILFESTNPHMLRDFVGVTSSQENKLNTKG